MSRGSGNRTRAQWSTAWQSTLPTSPRESDLDWMPIPYITFDDNSLEFRNSLLFWCHFDYKVPTIYNYGLWKKYFSHINRVSFLHTLYLTIYILMISILARIFNVLSQRQINVTRNICINLCDFTDCNHF